MQSKAFEIPMIGLGTYAGDNFEILLRSAIDLGYRHIDTAVVYKNEKLIGQVLSDILKSGKVARSDLFITTKIWNDPSISTLETMKNSLKDLQIEYVDLCLVHWSIGVPDSENQKIIQKPLYVFWKEMEELVKLGLTRHIGVSNFNCQLLMDLLSYAEIKPKVNQLEVHPYLSQKDLIEWCQKVGIHVTAYSPLCRGGADVKEVFGDIVDVFNEPVLKEISAKHKRSIAQVILNFLLSRGISVIPKSSNPNRLKENLECTDFNLDEEDKNKIFALNKGWRTINPKKRADMLYYPAFD